MVPWNALRNAHNAPIATLIGLFLSWKLLLLTLAILSPGLGYDTSTQLLFRGYGVENIAFPSGAATSRSIGQQLAQKLTRWDAIYFATSAERGYQLEQEWAFGWGLTRLLAFLAKCESIFCIFEQSGRLRRNLHLPLAHRRSISLHCLRESGPSPGHVSAVFYFWQIVSSTVPCIFLTYRALCFCL